MSIFSIDTESLEKQAEQDMLRPRSPFMTKWVHPCISPADQIIRIPKFIIEDHILKNSSNSNYLGALSFDTELTFKKYLPNVTGLDLGVFDVEFRSLNGHLSENDFSYLRGCSISIYTGSINGVHIESSHNPSFSTNSIIKIFNIQNIEDSLLKADKVEFKTGTIPVLKNVEIVTNQLSIYLYSIECIKNSHPILYRLLSKSSQLKEKGTQGLSTEMCSLANRDIRTKYNIDQILGPGYDGVENITITTTDASEWSLDQPQLQIRVGKNKKANIKTLVYNIDPGKLLDYTRSLCTKQYVDVDKFWFIKSY